MHPGVFDGLNVELNVIIRLPLEFTPPVLVEVIEEREHLDVGQLLIDVDP